MKPTNPRQPATSCATTPRRAVPVPGVARAARGVRPTRKRDGEDGSVATEVVLVAPLLLLLMLLIVLAGRVVDLRLQVASTAHQAARAASQQSGPGAATAAAARITAELGPRCAAPASTLDTPVWVAGGSVTVRVTCTANLSDLVPLPVPGQVPVSASFTSPIDRWATVDTP